MQKKIFCIFFILLMLLIPIRAFADNVYLEIKDNGEAIKLEISNSGDVNIKSKGDVNKSVSYSIDKETIERIINYLDSNINYIDEIEYDANKELSNYQNNYEENGYLLKICQKSNCKSYYNNNILMSFDELENGEIGQLLTEALKDELRFIIYMILLIMIVSLLFFSIPIIIIIKVIKNVKKSSTSTYNTTNIIDNYDKPSKSYTVKTIKSNKKEYKTSNDSNKKKKDPFEV